MTVIESRRISLRLISEEDAPELQAYYMRNARHLEPWEHSRPDGYHTIPEWEKRAKQFAEEISEGHSYRFAARLHGDAEVMAVANFTNVVRGAFLACNLGYSIDARCQGRNLMFEGLSVLIPYVFQEYRLHRIMANYIPENTRSANF
ncbi:GNAT family N-acetyltransferase [Paracoccus saliphilus]|uniref:GNAT family N-acetyltransferase n=1 Tax=Paracoccus saliphilus TaxID=405559 RepID=A0AA45W4G4_9RHOB|nr:GNAT family N-acetyltransferase [Paracoccus saliphilus]WCR04076.1 GNAT family N-acetyltransferase [Paracoccus saliphilus]SIS84632.1 [SSU ribosomal protein S5P]-alanine acetyltransferase [Paracoccus saliphilus]